MRAEGRELIAEQVDDADQEALLGIAEAALCGNWTLLDGVERLGAR